MRKLVGQLVAALSLLMPSLRASENNLGEMLKEESNAILERCQRIAAQFYCLSDSEEFKEVTNQLVKGSKLERCIA